MFRKFVFVFSILIIVCSASGPTALAQAPVSNPVHPAGLFSPEYAAHLAASHSQTASSTNNLALGQPGLSYRYVRTFGETQVPYLVDTTHLNQPAGIFIDSNNNLFITEHQGSRVLKYNSSGINQWAIGKAGVSGSENYVYSTLEDVTVDHSGNVWAADANRLVEYLANGVFIQQYPTDGASGNDNNHFNAVEGIAFTSNGLMIVSDSNNQRVQVYSNSSGAPVYSATLGVTGETGTDNDHFNQPRNIAVDSQNNLYVTDTGNNRVQKCINSGGWTCTPLDTSLNSPQGIAVDSSDNVYFADFLNFRIRKCSAVGTCVDFATQTSPVTDLAVDTSGNVYSTYIWGDSTVVKYNNTGELVGPYLGVQWVPYLTDPYHYNRPRPEIDQNQNLLIIEQGSGRLVKLDPNGNLIWSFGGPTSNCYANNDLCDPYRAVVDNNGKIYVADGWGCRVKIICADGFYLNTLGTGCGTGDYEFSTPSGVAVDNNGKIYVADTDNHRVMIYDHNLNYIGRIGVTGECTTANDHLCGPKSVAVDAAGNIYVTDAYNLRVQKFNSSYQWQMTIGNGTWGGQFDQFAHPEDVAVDAKGKIYVADWTNNRIQVYDSKGAYLTSIGGSGGTGSSQFLGADGVAVDNQGNVYASDYQNHRIQKFSPGVPGWIQTNINGFGQPNDNVNSLQVFNNQLYAGTSNWTGSGGRIYRSSRGSDWNPVSLAGFGDGGAVPAMMAMVVFKGKLYAATGWGSGNNGARIYRSATGASWDEVVSDGFGDANNQSVDALAVFNNWIYASVANLSDGAQVWRSSTGNANTWTRVGAANFTIAHLDRLISFAEFNGKLYAIGGKLDSGAEVWRTDNGTNWSQVFTDGLGVPGNLNNPNLIVFNNQLYASQCGSTLGVQVWRSSTGAAWNKVVADGFGDPNNICAPFFVFNQKLYAVTSNLQTGAQLWYSTNGAAWHKTGIDGFGDSNNYFWWNNNIAIFKGQPFIATLNSVNGGEIWKFLYSSN